MAIVRFKQKPETFKFEGITVGIRKPTTAEMEEITKRRSAYIKTVAADLVEARKTESGLPAEGDGAMLLRLQEFVSGMLCCDPDDVSNPWFAADAKEQEQLAKSGVEKDTPDDVPAEFHMTAFAKFTGAYAEPTEGDAKDTAPLPPETAEPTAPTTTSISDASSSESQNTSESTPSASENGGTTTSETPSATSSSS